MARGELKNAEFFVFTENLVFDSVLYNWTSKIPLLFELVIRLHKLQMRWEIIFHVIHIADTQLIEAGICGLSNGDNLGGTMRGQNH